MQVEKLRQVFIVARDLEAQVGFYRDVLGLPLAFRDGNRWVQFQAGDVSFALAAAEEGGGAQPGATVPVFLVPDIEAARVELEELGVECGSIRDMGEHGRSTTAVDPGGARIVLFQRSG